MGFEAILDAVRDLSPADQLRLVHTIRAELALDLLEESGSPPAGFTPGMAATIKARLARYKADPSVAVPWADVEANVDMLLKEFGERKLSTCQAGQRIHEAMREDDENDPLLASYQDYKRQK